MTREEWDKCSEDEKAEEVEKCKDLVYFYNTYWKKPGMPSVTKEEFIEIKSKIIHDLNLRKVRLHNAYPITNHQCIIILNSKKSE